MLLFAHDLVVGRSTHGKEVQQEGIEEGRAVMRERKRGTLRSGRSGKKVTSRKQAIAIGSPKRAAPERKCRSDAAGSSRTTKRRA